MQSFDWYVNRLKGMSAAEISSRIGRSMMTAAELAGRWLPQRLAAADIRNTQSWLSIDSGGDAENLRVAADRVLSGQVPIFSLIDHDAGRQREWNRDPLTGTVAPMRFGPSIDIRSSSLVGNIKYLWEPNRHLQLVVLAHAFNLSGDTKYLDGLREQLSSWFEQCPYLVGPNWSSPLEPAIRLINWAIAWQLIGGADSRAFDGADGKAFRGAWLESIYQHVRFIRGRYSGFSSANNHLIGEAAGVFIATCTWPFWGKFERWRNESQRILIDECERQNSPDGVNREQAMSYQQFVLDFLVLSGLAGKAAGLDMPDGYWRRIREMLVFIASMIDVAGNMPMFGDADDGYVVRLSREPDFCPFKSLLATGAILFDEPGFAAAAGCLDDKTRLLVGEQGWEKLMRRVTAGDFEPVARRSFPEGGYYVLGSDLGTADEIRLVADAGPLGYLSLAAHGHADALSVVLSVRGREFLVDPGTYTYHGNETWRQYFRGTRAHNTVCIDDTDQSESGGTFLWMTHANAQCTEFQCDASGGEFCGEHDGYMCLHDPVSHSRRIRAADRRIVIRDTLTCEGRHSVDRCWHFSEQCDVEVVNGEVHASNGQQTIRMRCQEPDTGIVAVRGQETPPAGWLSRHFDMKQPCTSVFMSNEITGTSVLTVTIECD